MALRCLIEAPETIRNGLLPLTAIGQNASKSGGARLGRVQGFRVVCPCAGDHKRLHAASLPQDRFAVFHAENIVGLADNVGRAERAQSLRPRRSVGDARGKGFPQTSIEVRIELEPCCRHQRFSPPLLAAEAQSVTAELAQDPNAARGKALGGGQDVRDRELQNQVRTAADGGLCAQMGRENRWRAALNPIAAHQTDDGGILPKLFADRAKLAHMPVMEGIVFTDHADEVHAVRLRIK